jgi:hypothetical protein
MTCGALAGQVTSDSTGDTENSLTYLTSGEFDSLLNWCQIGFELDTVQDTNTCIWELAVKPSAAASIR